MRWFLLCMAAALVAAMCAAGIWSARLLQGAHAIVSLLGWSQMLVWLAPTGLAVALLAVLGALGRRPLLAALPAGVIVSLLGSWLCMIAHVIPAEAATRARLEAAQLGLHAAYEIEGAYPEPGPEQSLRFDAGDDGHTVAALDAFGRPFVYETSGMWVMQAYRVRSLGFDGVVSFDDACVAGSTPMGTVLDKLRQVSMIAGLIKELVVQDPDTGVAQWLQSVNRLSCP